MKQKKIMFLFFYLIGPLLKMKYEASAKMLEYFSSLSKDISDVLFSNTDFVLFLFYLLSSSEKFFILHFLFSKNMLTINNIKEMYSSKHTKALNQSLLYLKKLGILQLEEGHLKLKARFGETLHDFFVEGKQRNRKCFFIYQKKVDVSVLEEIALERFENIVYQMCDGGSYIRKKKVSNKNEITKDYVLLETRNSNYIQEKIIKRKNVFQSLLLADVGTLLWEMILLFIQDPVEEISFLISIYNSEQSVLYKEQKHVHLIDVLSELGVILIVNEKTKKERMFFITSLSQNLFNVLPKRKVSKQHGVIIETNFRAYLYSDNNLTISLFRLFIQEESQFLLENETFLLSGILTHESVKKVFKLGITADQVLSFLSLNAHPEVDGNIPRNVSDQVLLWEKENHRIMCIDGTIYQGFPTFLDFEKNEKNAKRKGAIVYSNNEKEILIVSDWFSPVLYSNKIKQTNERNN